MNQPETPDALDIEPTAGRTSSSWTSPLGIRLGEPSSVVIAFADQGGVARNATQIHSLGTRPRRRRVRTLLSDVSDPGACLTWSTGTDPDTLERSLHDVLLGRCSAADAVVKVNDLHLLPSTIDVAGAEVHHAREKTGQYVAPCRARSIALEVRATISSTARPRPYMLHDQSERPQARGGSIRIASTNHLCGAASDQLETVDDVRATQRRNFPRCSAGRSPRCTTAARSSPRR